MPSVRARQLQLLLAHIEGLPLPERREVLGRIAPADLLLVRTAAAFDWTPMRIATAMARAVTETLGPERAREFFKEQFAVTLTNAVLGALVRTVTQYVAADPRRGVRWLPRGHDLLFKGVGRLTVETHPLKPEAIFTLSDLPPEIASDRMWLDRYAWSLGSLQTLWRFTTECEVFEVRPDERMARLRMTWRETPRPR